MTLSPQANERPSSTSQRRRNSRSRFERARDAALVLLVFPLALGGFIVLEVFSLLRSFGVAPSWPWWLYPIVVYLLGGSIAYIVFRMLRKKRHRSKRRKNAV